MWCKFHHKTNSLFLSWLAFCSNLTEIVSVSASSPWEPSILNMKEQMTVILSINYFQDLCTHHKYPSTMCAQIIERLKSQNTWYGPLPVPIWNASCSLGNRQRSIWEGLVHLRTYINKRLNVRIRRSYFLILTRLILGI